MGDRFVVAEVGLQYKIHFIPLVGSDARDTQHSLEWHFSHI